MNSVTEEKYPDDLSDITDIPVGTIFRDWHEDGIRIIINRGPCHPCVYFGIPVDHPLAGRSYDDLPVSVHGGLTFSDKGDGKFRPEGYWWYGYDYGHCNDAMFPSSPKMKKFMRGTGKRWTLKEIKEDSWGGLYDFKRLMRLAEKIKENP